jgi:hypothetical protein
MRGGGLGGAKRGLKCFLNNNNNQTEAKTFEFYELAGKKQVNKKCPIA